jgi:hypothetical protein
VVDEPGHKLPKARDGREPGHEGKGPRQEGPSERILEDAAAFGKGRLERAKKRVLFCCATCMTFSHGFTDRPSTLCRPTDQTLSCVAQATDGC